jgi:uncharacterized membrane protein
MRSLADKAKETSIDYPKEYTTTLVDLQTKGADRFQMKTVVRLTLSLIVLIIAAIIIDTNRLSDVSSDDSKGFF